MSRAERADPAGVREVPAEIHWIGHGATRAVARVRHRARRARWVRAARGLLACWGLAVAAVFLPLLHFVLVPALLLAGPVVALLRLGEQVTLLDVRGACPACGREQTVGLGRAAEARLPFRCEGCGRPLEIAADLAGLGA